MATVRIDDDVYEQMKAETPEGQSVTRYINDKLAGRSNDARFVGLAKKAPQPQRPPRVPGGGGKRFVPIEECNHPPHLVLEHHCGACGSYVK